MHSISWTDWVQHQTILVWELKMIFDQSEPSFHKQDVFETQCVGFASGKRFI